MAASCSASRVRAFLRSRRPDGSRSWPHSDTSRRLATAAVCQLRYLSLPDIMGAMAILTSPTDGRTDEQAYARRWWTLAVLCLSLLIVFGGNSTLNVALPDAVARSRRERVAAAVGGRRRTRSCSPACSSRRARSATGSAARARCSSGSPRSSSPACSRRRRPTSRRSSPAARVMGVGAAFIMPSTLSILVNVFPPHERAKAIAIWATTTGVAGSIGPVDHRLGARALLVRLRVPRVPPGDRARVRRRMVLRAEVARPQRERDRPARRAALDRRRVRARLRVHRGARQGLGRAGDDRRVRDRGRRAHALRVVGAPHRSRRCSTCGTSATRRSAWAAAP